jgi:DNA-binding NarL/FixJ family response regulator
MKKIRVLVADDHQLVRAGICSLLENAKGIEVVAEADDGYRVMELASRHNPDVVLMDIAMPKMNGLETTSQLLAIYPEIKVIILSMHVNEEYVWQALRSRASGYLLKDAAPIELERAINSVADGSTYLSPAVSHHVINDYVRRVNEKQAGQRN